MSFPYIPVKSDKTNGMAFRHIETGKVFDFDSSWRNRLDAVERILVQNATQF